MGREITVALRYDPDADVATLRLDPRRAVVRHSVRVRPPDVPAAEGVAVDDHSVALRLKFNAIGRLHGIDFLVPRQQLPSAVLEAVDVEPDQRE